MTVRRTPISDICACGCGRPIIVSAANIRWPRLGPGEIPDYRPHNLTFPVRAARLSHPPSVPVLTGLHYGNNL